MAESLKLTDDRRLAYQEAALELGPALYLPLDSANGLTDLAGNYTASAAGGLTAGGYSSGPLATPNNLGATDFDASDDYITTDCATRRNLCKNPRFASDTSLWVAQGSVTLTRITTDGVIDDTCLEVDCAGAGGLEGAYFGLTTTAVNHKMGAYIKAPVGVTVDVVFSGSPVTQHEGTGEWTWVETAAAVANAGPTFFYTRIISSVTPATFYVGGCLVETSSTLGTYFDGSGYVSDSGSWVSDPGGSVGWLGTAHASASDRGCFSNGTTRTFSGFIYRDNQDDYHTILAGSETTAGFLRFNISADTVQFYIDATTSTSWTSVGIGAAEWHHWALVVDEPNDAAYLYIDGALLSSKTASSQWTPPGPLQYGMRGTTTRPFDGKMAGVAVFERGLTSHEIAELYAAASRPTRTYDFMDNDNPIRVQSEGLQLPTPSRDDTWVETPDADGRRRVRSRLAGAEGSFSVFIRSTSAATLWDAVDDLQELVESAHRNKGQLTYTPPNGDPVTYDLEAIQVSDLPQRGHLLRTYNGEAEVSFEARPYGRLPQVSLGSDTLTGPVDGMVVSDVPGSAPAWGRLILSETASQPRHFVEVGLEHDHDPDNAAPLLLEAVDDLTALAAGSSTRTGSVASGGTILRAAVTTATVAMVTTGAQPHSGKWKVRARLYSSAAGGRVRLAWRTGTAPFQTERWVSIPQDSQWCDVDLGTVDLLELEGTHTWEGRIEGAALEGTLTIDTDIVSMVPADSYTKLRGSTTTGTSSSPVIAFDDFSGIASGDPVTAETPLIVPAGSWSGAGDATDYTKTTGGEIQRTALSDSAVNNGRYLRAGSGTLTTSTVQVDVNLDCVIPFFDSRHGVFLRYVDTSNWLGAFYQSAYTLPLTIIKCVAGVETELGSVAADPDQEYGLTGWRTLMLSATSSGGWAVLDAPMGQALEWRMVSFSADSSLATGGALQGGGYGIYDAVVSSSAPTERYYDNFQVTAASESSTLSNPALEADRTAILAHDTAQTEADDGATLGRTPLVTGQYLQLPPATRGGRKSRLVVRTRREDVDAGLEDNGETDTVDVDLLATPRVPLIGDH